MLAVAVPVVHQLQPDPGTEVDRPRELRADAQRRPAAPLAAGHLHLRVRRRAAAADLRPGARHGAGQGHARTGDLPVGLLPALDARQLVSPSRCCGGRSSAPTAWSTRSSRLFGIEGQIGWISDPSYALWTLILLHVWTFGSPMVIFLAGLRQIPGMYYEAASVDGATPVASVQPRSPCRCCRRSSSSTWCCRSSTPSSRSPRPSSSRAAPAVRRTRRCSTRCTCTSKGFGQFQMGYASAMAWLLVVIVGAFTGDQLLPLKVLGVLR